jgi:hypothetical protein
MRTAIALAGSLLLLTGCYVEEESTETTRAPEPPAETDAPASTAQPTAGGRSTMGKAKQSATNTVGQLEQRDKELQRQLDEE